MFINYIILFRTFEALNECCFLANGVEYVSFFNKPDEFLDLQNVVTQTTDEIINEDGKTDTLFNVIDMSYR